MTRRYVHPDQVKEVKEPEAKPAPEVLPHDISIDDLLGRGIRDIGMILVKIRSDILASVSVPSRETVQSLKDCLAMLSDLKKKEQELLESLSETELEAKLGKK